MYDKYGVEGLKGQESPRNSKGSTFKADEAFGGGGGASVNHRPQNLIQLRRGCLVVLKSFTKDLARR